MQRFEVDHYVGIEGRCAPARMHAVTIRWGKFRSTATGRTREEAEKKAEKFILDQIAQMEKKQTSQLAVRKETLVAKITGGKDAPAAHDG